LEPGLTARRHDRRPQARERETGRHGIRREQIAAIGDAESGAKKQALFEKVRQGSVRVLIGSTQKMGTGTHVQKRLVAEHDLDPVVDGPLKFDSQSPWHFARVVAEANRVNPGNKKQSLLPRSRP
jgi:hypothetical protein